MPKKKKTDLVNKIATDLINQNVITKDQLSQAKKLQQKKGYSLDKALVELKIVTNDEIMGFIASKLDIPNIDLASYLIEPDVIDMISEDSAKKYKIVPLFKVEDTLTGAMSNPMDVFALDDLKLKSHLEIKPVLSDEDSINKAIEQYYGGTHLIEETIEKAKSISVDIDISEPYGVARLERVSEQTPIVRLVDQLITEAVKDKASDIHIEPQKEDVNIRYRIDGILHNVSTLPKHLQLSVISRIKIMASLDIAERRTPQDGRIQIKLGEKDIDIRVSTFPTIFGEKIALRILDKSRAITNLVDLGLESENLARLRSLIRKPNGFVFIVGPTGSGKTTTLYALLHEINSPDKNIVTLEDPVEYEIKHINQGQINPKADVTFAKGLRSILRQDPNIIMIGEVRDLETAELAVRAALTGHLVFSTLHTMDAATSLTRLVDMGVEPFLISSSITGLVAQRLVRKICPKCKEEYKPSKELLKQIGWENKKNLKAYRGKGCKSCKQTGYKGRVGIFEVVAMNEEIKRLITSDNSANIVREEIRKSGAKSLQEDGLKKVSKGITTIEEILKETINEE